MTRALACLLLATAVSAVFSSASPGSPAATRCQPTRGDAAGPFQQITTVPRRAKIGTGHVLLGRVLRAPDCAPVARALVVVWQAGPSGYTRAGQASVVTDRAGRFRFEGPVPASYGREPHIHIVVSHPAYRELLTRYVVRPGTRTGRIRLVLAPLL
jgi:protocatechuate 3,4-dioxygenase beta subunit